MKNLLFRGLRRTNSQNAKRTKPVDATTAITSNAHRTEWSELKVIMKSVNEWYISALRIIDY